MQLSLVTLRQTPQVKRLLPDDIVLVPRKKATLRADPHRDFGENTTQV
jgi:hypothetical protein